MFCLFGLSLLIGAPTSSGVFILLFESFVLGLLVLWKGLFDISLFPLELYMLLEASLDLLFFIFLGFSINWIGGLDGLLIDWVELLRKFFLSWLKFCAGLFCIFWFIGFDFDWGLLIILGLLGLLGLFSWLGIVFTLSGLLSGFVSNGFLFSLSLGDFCLLEEITEDLSSLFCL